MSGGASGIGEGIVEAFVRQDRRSRSSTCSMRRARRWSRADRRLDHAGFAHCDITDSANYAGQIGADRPHWRLRRAGQQRRQRRSPQARGRYARLLGRAHRGQPAAPVLRSPGGDPGGLPAAARSSTWDRSAGTSGWPTSRSTRSPRRRSRLTRSLAREGRARRHPGQHDRAGQRPDPTPVAMVRSGGRGRDRRRPVSRRARPAVRRRRYGAVPRVGRCPLLHRAQLLGRRRMEIAARR